MLYVYVIELLIVRERRKTGPISEEEKKEKERKRRSGEVGDGWRPVKK